MHTAALFNGGAKVLRTGKEWTTLQAFTVARMLTRRLISVANLEATYFKAEI